MNWEFSKQAYNMQHSKKFYAFFLGLVLFAGLLFVIQILKAKNITIKKSNEPLLSQMLVDIPLDVNDPPFYGNAGSPITVVEFMDFNCEKCLEIDKKVRNFIDKNPQEVRLLWKDAPGSGFIFKDMALAHQAAYCAGKENKFWNFIDLAEQKKKLSENDLRYIAEQIGLNMEYWWQCANSDSAKQIIQDSKNSAKNFGASKLPLIFVNNRQINTDDINIEELLAEFVEK